LSIATLVITGVLLYALGVLLTRESWAIVLGGLTLVGVAAWVFRDALMTEPRRPMEQPVHGTRASDDDEDGLLGPREEAPQSVQRLAGWRGLVPRIALLAMLLVAALEAASALVVANSGQRHKSPGFTQLWALPSQHMPFRVDVGVRSYERHRADYHILVTVNHRIRLRRAVVLAPTRLWQSTLVLGDRVGQRVDVTLWMRPNRSVYRHVRIWTGDAPPASVASTATPFSVASLRLGTVRGADRVNRFGLAAIIDTRR
jgi:hypothetical protein